MPNTKTATLTFRVDPKLKEALKQAAMHEHRSLANMIEVLIRDYCMANGIAIPDTATALETNYEKHLSEEPCEL